MVTAIRMSNVVSDALRNRSDPNQTQPSRLYAQAKEATKDDEWGVSNPYDPEESVKKTTKTPEQQLKECLDKCGKKPKYAHPTDAFVKAKKKAFKSKTKTWLECRQKCKMVKAESPKPEPGKTKGKGGIKIPKLFEDPVEEASPEQKEPRKAVNPLE